MCRMFDRNKDCLALAILMGFFAARLFFALTLGLGVDESYTIAISRRLCLSYFDHPPLHLWLTHFAALTVGESKAARIPFVLLFVATGWLYYRFTRDIFCRRPALIALFALNVSPFFFASAGEWIVPDGPLLFGLAVAAFGGEPRLLFEASRSDFGVATLACCRSWPWPSRTVEVQRGAHRCRTRRRSSCFRPSNGIGLNIPRHMFRQRWRSSS